VKVLCRQLPVFFGQRRRGSFLLVDAIPHGSRLPEPDRAELRRVASRALWAADRGIADLVQRRHGPDDYSYV
jgi:hypothetical protein